MVYVYINAAQDLCTIMTVEVESWLNDIMLYFFNINSIHSHAQILVPDCVWSVPYDNNDTGLNTQRQNVQMGFMI